jgi:hypothetical protein
VTAVSDGCARLLNFIKSRAAVRLAQMRVGFRRLQKTANRIVVGNGERRRLMSVNEQNAQSGIFRQSVLGLLPDGSGGQERNITFTCCCFGRRALACVTFRAHGVPSAKIEQVVVHLFRFCCHPLSGTKRFDIAGEVCVVRRSLFQGWGKSNLRFQTGGCKQNFILN